jgi:hypothetical protein
MDDRRFERLHAEVSEGPDIMEGRKELTLYPGTPGNCHSVDPSHYPKDNCDAMATMSL